MKTSYFLGRCKVRMTKTSGRLCCKIRCRIDRQLANHHSNLRVPDTATSLLLPQIAPWVAPVGGHRAVRLLTKSLKNQAGPPILPATLTNSLRMSMMSVTLTGALRQRVGMRKKAPVLLSCSMTIISFNDALRSLAAPFCRTLLQLKGLPSLCRCL